MQCCRNFPQQCYWYVFPHSALELPVCAVTPGFEAIPCALNFRDRPLHGVRPSSAFCVLRISLPNYTASARGEQPRRPPSFTAIITWMGGPLEAVPISLCTPRGCFGQVRYPFSAGKTCVEQNSPIVPPATSRRI